MLTEFEVRNQAGVIVRSGGTPMAIVRRLLRLIRPIKLRSRVLIHTQAVTARRYDLFTAAHLDRLIRRLRMLYDDVRQEAYRMLLGERVLGKTAA